MKSAPIAIIGGGLSGLCSAYRLHQRGIAFQLFEARDRLGGRIFSTQPHGLDLGPSWFWPGQQQIASLIMELGLQAQVHAQASDGLSVMEYADGSLQRSHGGASMAGSNRLAGGMKRIIDTLAGSLPAECIQTSNDVQHIARTADGISLGIRQFAAESTRPFSHVILALPPRVVSQRIRFQPELPSIEKQWLDQVPTWMAGQCKFIAEYADAFWLEQGLSGDGFSQLGPLSEIHDASPLSGSTQALFGFVGIAPEQRRGKDNALKQAAIEQLTRLFGDAAGSPIAVHLKDWAFDERTATDHDRRVQGSQGHSRPTLDREWDDRVLWAGTETASLSNHSNGYLEGAVESGNRAAALAVQLLEHT